MSGARWVQRSILNARPDAKVRVYAIYFEVVEGDRGAKGRVDPKSLLDDPRVVSFWDDDKVTGRWFDENVTKLGARQGESDRVEWDSFVLYDAKATWGEKAPYSVSWGRPLFDERERLKRDLFGTLDRARESGTVH